MTGKGLALANRTVLISGASSGLGPHLARLVAQAGANVVLGARRVALLTSLAHDIINDGGTALSVPMDVTDEASVSKTYDAAEARFGVVDTIIACAGIAEGGAATDQPIEDFAATVQVNLTGTFLTVREGARRMIAAGKAADGRAVLVSSITAEHVSPGLAAYSASKAAVVQMGRVMAREWARHGLCVNMILPGYFKTDLNADWFDSEGGAKQIASWPRRRLMQLSDLDPIVTHLCSDAARGTTGASFKVDDGQTL